MLYQFISLPMELLHIYHAASIHIIPNKNYCIYIMLYQFISYHIITQMLFVYGTITFIYKMAQMWANIPDKEHLVYCHDSAMYAQCTCVCVIWYWLVQVFFVFHWIPPNLEIFDIHAAYDVWKPMGCAIQNCSRDLQMYSRRQKGVFGVFSANPRLPKYLWIKVLFTTAQTFWDMFAFLKGTWGVWVAFGTAQLYKKCIIFLKMVLAVRRFAGSPILLCPEGRFLLDCALIISHQIRPQTSQICAVDCNASIP